MATRKAKKAASDGRKSAYVARNRATIINSTQQALAEIGPQATIEQISELAGISVSTIYKHFENKEALMQEAYLSGFHNWELWADEILKDVSDPLEELIAPMRLLLRIKNTHPIYAQMTALNMAQIPKYFPITEQGLTLHIKELSKSGILKIDNLTIRIRMVSACLLAALGEQLFNPNAKLKDADNAIEVIMEILGLSESKAKKLAHSELPNF